MKIVVQRVARAEVRVDGRVVGKIGRGLLLLVALEKGDDEPILDSFSEKVVNLRLFPDETGKMNRSSLDEGIALLAVSQFTLAGSLERGRRPSFENAAPAEEARDLFGRFVEKLRAHGLRVETGLFRALMEVELVNDGPVTFVLEGGKR
ncbi:MAG TPA: D-aminoacyl-tRNA deacylase [Candidatus Polarisedimenticolia bacterium]|nr:D-aminoacyl-tRNA deacylase [Candidatus Polarisedimenticolia bacterium]